MSDEVEKKYLVKKEILKVLLKNSFSLVKKKINQHYLKVNPYSQSRVRSVDKKKFIFTQKNGSGASREEVEKELERREYLEYKANSIGDKISKNRYLFYVDNIEYSLDIYKKSLKPLVVLEVEFENIEKFKDFQPPPFLKEFILEDVTLNEKYKNHNLALFGLPSKKNRLFANSTTKEALVIKLSTLLSEVEKYKNAILEKNEIENLHQFRVNIRQSRALISEFGNYFDRCLLKVIKDRLKKIVKQTNYQRDLDVFYESLKDEKEDVVVEFLKYINLQREKENRKFIEFLKSPLYEAYIKECLFLLKNDYLFKQNSNEVLIAFSLKDAIEKQEKLIIKNLQKISKSSPIEKLHQIRIEFKKIRYLIENFNSFYNSDEVKKFFKSLKWYQDNLGYLNDYSNQIRIVENFLEDDLDENLKLYLNQKLQQLHKKNNRQKDKIVKRCETKGLAF